MLHIKLLRLLFRCSMRLVIKEIYFYISYISYLILKYFLPNIFIKEIMLFTCWPLQPCTICLLAKNFTHLNIEWYHIPTILRAIHCASSFTLISKHFSIIKQMISLKRKKNPLRMKQKEMTWQKNTFINEYFVLIFSFKSNSFVWDEISVWYYIHRFCLISSLSRYQN